MSKNKLPFDVVKNEIGKLLEFHDETNDQSGIDIMTSILSLLKDSGWSFNEFTAEVALHKIPPNNSGEN